MRRRWLLAVLVGLSCAGLQPRDAVDVSHLLPLADPMGPGDTALGRCVGAVSERGALLEGCGDLDLLLEETPGGTATQVPEYRREIVDAPIGARDADPKPGARYAWSVERVILASRRLTWRAEADLTDGQIEAIAGACRGAARGGHVVVAEYQGCGVLIPSGDLSVDPPRSVEEVFEAKRARGEVETRGAPEGFLLLAPGLRESDFDPATARCGGSATLLVGTRSLADVCLDRVPGLVGRAARRRQDAMLDRIGSLELRNGELRTLLDGCRERNAELGRRLDAEQLANAALRAQAIEAAQRAAVADATREGAAQAVRSPLDACRDAAPASPEPSGAGTPPGQDAIGG